jgi:hypothetical protein
MIYLTHTDSHQADGVHYAAIYKKICEHILALQNRKPIRLPSYLVKLMERLRHSRNSANPRA